MRHYPAGEPARHDDGRYSWPPPPAVPCQSCRDRRPTLVPKDEIVQAMRVQGYVCCASADLGVADGKRLVTLLFRRFEPDSVRFDKTLSAILGHLIFGYHVLDTGSLLGFGPAEESGTTRPDKPARGHRRISYRLRRPSNRSLRRDPRCAAVAPRTPQTSLRNEVQTRHFSPTTRGTGHSTLIRVLGCVVSL
jgi:hypothetical protein